MRSGPLALGLTATLTAVLLSGCGGFAPSAPSTVTTTTGVALKGHTFGGQQPVSGATIQLYQVGSTGYGTGATALLSTTVTTGSDGSFTVPGTFTCTTGMDVYITATGGNSGFGTNSAIALMSGLGLCESLSSITFVSINEVTTVGAVWALSPFMSGTTIGAPSTNQAGLVSAFADIAQIVNNTTGLAPGPSLPTGAVAPTAEIYTLADIVASCINSASSSSTSCSSLFSYTTPSGGAAPTNTIAAAVNMARNPGSNVNNLSILAGSSPPFSPTLASVTDFTVGVTYPVGTTPAALAMDASNNLWVANNGSSSVTKLTHAGVAATYSVGSISQPTGIAIDTSGNVWISNTNNTVTELTSAGANVSGSPYSGGGLNLPTGIAIDGLGMVWVSNGGAQTASVFSSTGSAVTTTSGYAASNTTGTGELSVAINPH